MPRASEQLPMDDAVTPGRHRVVIVGGGFGGLHAARALAGIDASVTLIDRVNHHLFQPLLYQVATGILSEGEIAPALRGVLRRQDNVKVLLGEVTGFDLNSNRLTATEPDGRELTLAFDSLIVAAGMTTSYFGHDEWREVAPGLKTLDDARWLRSHILGAFEMAELARTAEERAAWLTFVVVGAGPTGVELTGEIATLARGVLPRDFRDIATLETRVVLLDVTPSVLPTFPESLRRRAAADLRGFGVEIRTSTAAAAIDADGIDITNPDGAVERITAHTVCWAAADRVGRLIVQPDLTLPGHPHVFVIGDMATVDGVPGVAQAAMQEGRYAAGVVASRLAGRPAPQPFQYKDKGTMAQVGPRRAVVDAYGLRIGGLIGSLMWAFIHVMYLIGWGNRVITVLRWLFQLTTRNRSQRLVDVRDAAGWRQPG